jgi:hypothetical protein
MAFPVCMYSIDMAPVSSNPYRCRLCGATTYRRLIERALDGAMRYSGLYRWSGCSVTFADPASWRRGQATHATSQRPPFPQLSSWGIQPPGDHTAAPGRSEADLKAIREAAARAAKGKSRGRRGG